MCERSSGREEEVRPALLASLLVPAPDTKPRAKSACSIVSWPTSVYSLV